MSMTLTEARDGFAGGRARVVCCPIGHEDQGAEDGTIVRVGERYVFVRYEGKPTPMATDPADLDWPVMIS